MSASCQLDKVLQYPFSHSPTLFGMELRGVEIALMQSGRIRLNIVCRSDGFTAQRNVVTMHEIHKIIFAPIRHHRSLGIYGTFPQSPKQRRFQILDSIPPHLRHFVLMHLRHKPLHLRIEHSQTIRVLLLTMPAQQLHAYADAQHRLFQSHNHLVQPMLLQISHRASRLSLSGENHTVSPTYQFGNVGHQRLYSKPPYRIFHRPDIASVIFNYRNIHLTPKIAYLGAKLAIFNETTQH